MAKQEKLQEEEISNEAAEETGIETPVTPENTEKPAKKSAPKKSAKKKSEAPAVNKTANGKKRGKKYLQAAAKIDADKTYSLEDALKLVPELVTTNFDPSVELHLRLGVNPKYADQNVRAAVTLPHGTGKSRRVLVLAEGDKAEAAEKAGADIVGGDELIAKISEGFLDFDVTIATPAMMPKIGRIAKTLGPKGLMPNPKLGTVTEKIADAVKEQKAGRVEFRADAGGNVHNAVGKASFDQKQLEENIKSLVRAVIDAKPSGAKGEYIKSAFLTLSMGPSVRIEVSSLS